MQPAPEKPLFRSGFYCQYCFYMAVVVVSDLMYGSIFWRSGRIYNTMMKIQPVCFIILLTLSLITSQTVIAQSLPQTTRTNPDQWRSHQMNQPAPAASENNDLSNERLEEIKQLYIEAQKELESRTNPLQPKSTQLNHQMKQPGSN